MLCQMCENDTFVKRDGFFYCLQCFCRVEDWIDDGVDDEDLARIFRREHTRPNPEPINPIFENVQVSDKEDTVKRWEALQEIWIAGEMAEENTAGTAICSICYEDLKPVVENLQSISACGHVFHELCLQQWFEYCPSTNKRNCPICKQKCSLKDPCRLYFQSSGNQIDSIASKKIVEIEEDPVLLRGEVKRLEGKIQNLTSALESQKKENVQVSDKLHQCNEQLKEDKVKRWEALQEISTTQHLLKLKSEECVQLTSQCAKLQERTMALAKELASLKLVSDLSLEEDDVLKLALLGNNAKTKDTIDTLVKSLVIRNRSYKELLAKCNQLGRGEARSSEKLEKALEKINKLKKRKRELEMISEERENRALRNIKASKRCSESEVSEPPAESLVSFRMLPSDNTVEKISTPPLAKLEKCDNPVRRKKKFSGKRNSTSVNTASKYV